MSHSHHHLHAPNTAVSWLLFALAVNIVFVVFEAFCGWLGDSVALWSDAGHNLSDVLGILLALLSLILQRRNHGIATKSSHYISLLNALLLLLAVALLAYESLKKCIAPVEVDGEVMMMVASMGIIVNAVTAWLLLKGSRENVNMRIAYLHALTDSLVSVGVVISGTVIMFTGWNRLDAIVGLFVSLLIAYPSLRILVNVFRLLHAHEE